MRILGRLLMSESDTAAGLTPLAFDSGEDALKAAIERKNEVAIVILDVNMPGMDGYVLLHVICFRITQERCYRWPGQPWIKTRFDARMTSVISRWIACCGQTLTHF